MKTASQRIKTNSVEVLLTMNIDQNTSAYHIENNFIVNNHKLHLDDMARFQIKQIVKAKYSKYRFVSNPQKKLKQEIHFSAKGAPAWIQKRTEQINVLIRTLIWQLRDSKDIDADLKEVLGESQWDPMFPMMLSVFPPNTLAGGIKDEWEEDYKEEVA